MKNGGVAYNGKVGANKRPRKIGYSRRSAVTKEKHSCIGGPMHGAQIWLQGDGATIEFVMNGHRGRYFQGRWEGYEFDVQGLHRDERRHA